MSKKWMNTKRSGVIGATRLATDGCDDDFKIEQDKRRATLGDR